MKNPLLIYIVSYSNSQIQHRNMEIPIFSWDYQFCKLYVTIFI